MNREEAIKRIRDFGLYHAIEDLPFSTRTVEAFETAIQALEEPERKHGRWKMTDAFLHWLYCDQCFKRIVPNANWIEEYDIPTNFCPNCGADMREETEDAEIC